MITTLLLLVSQATAGEAPSPTKQYHTLQAEYEREGGARALAGRFLELAAQFPQEPVSADALLWVVTHVRGRSDTTTALEQLAQHHITSDKLGPACGDIARSRSVAAGRLLRAAMQQSPRQPVRAQACYHLAALLETEANVVAQLRAQPALAPRIVQYCGQDYGQHLLSLTSAGLERQREQVYSHMLEAFADVEIDDSTMGEIARKMLFRIRHLSVGKTAPEIAGEDIDGKVFKLSDFRGKVVLLTFWGHW